jgi:hypothetical protein
MLVARSALVETDQPFLKNENKAFDELVIFLWTLGLPITIFANTHNLIYILTSLSYRPRSFDATKNIP